MNIESGGDFAVVSIDPTCEIFNLDPAKVDDLEPCPFCGNTELELGNDYSPAYYVDCPCGASMMGQTFDGPDLRKNHNQAKENAINNWNRRL